MIQTQPMLEDFGVQRPTGGGCGGNGGMVGAATPLHHHHHHHHPHHHHPNQHPHQQLNNHHNPHTPGGVYMKPVYNLSSLCHQGPLTPPEKMSPTSQSTSSSLSPSSSAPLHHLPVYPPHGAGGAETGSGAATNGHAGHFRPGHLQQQHNLSMPMFPAKRLRSGADNNHHPHHHHNEMLRCKRRVDLSLKLGYKTHPTAVARRNERERNRVKHINSTFTTLRQHIPCAAKNKKMSKVETLRSAIRYINHLQQILETQKAEEEEGEGDGEDGEEEHGEGAEGGPRQRHHHHIRHLHHPTIHLFSPGGSSSIGSPGADTTSPTTHLNCDVTAVRMRSSVLLSPPGSPTSCDGRPGSADSHDLSPRRHYDYVTGIHDDDDADDVDNDVDDDDDDPHDLSQFGDWF